MGTLPPVSPVIGTSSRVRLGRDYYVRACGNDYSVDPSMIGRFVDVHTGLDLVQVHCGGVLVASHEGVRLSV
jgi:ribosomal protein S19